MSPIFCRIVIKLTGPAATRLATGLGVGAAGVGVGAGGAIYKNPEAFFKFMKEAIKTIDPQINAKNTTPGSLVIDVEAETKEACDKLVKSHLNGELLAIINKAVQEYAEKYDDPQPVYDEIEIIYPKAAEPVCKKVETFPEKTADKDERKEDLKVDGYATNLLQELNEKRSSGFLCDAEIVVNGKSFPAHKIVLSASSEYFRTMFSTNMKEKYSGKVELKQLNENAVKEILDYIYTGTITISEINISDLLQAASVMLLKNLLKEINNFLLKSVCPENCLKFRKIGILFSLDSLQKKVEDCILENFAIVSDQEEFKQLSLHDVKVYFASNKIQVETEDVMFKALMCWISSDLMKRKEHFPELFRFIRLQHVTEDFLLNTIRNEKLVKGDHGCRDLVEDAMHFQFQPDKFAKQKRRCFTDNDPIRMCLLNEQSAIQPLHFRDTLQTGEEIVPEMHISYSSAVAVRGNVVYFCGGFVKDSNIQASNSIISFDGQTWKVVGKMNYARANAMVVFYGESLAIFGGENNGQFVNVTEEFKNGTCKIFTNKNLQHNRRCGSAVHLNGMIHVIGGFSTLPNQRQVAAYNHAQHILPTGAHTGQYSYLTEARANFGCAVKGTTIFLFGGVGKNNQQSNTAEFCDNPDDNSRYTRLTSSSVPLGVTSAEFYSYNQVLVLGRSGKPLCFDVVDQSWKDNLTRSSTAAQQSDYVRLCSLTNATVASGKLFRLQQIV